MGQRKKSRYSRPNNNPAVKDLLAVYIVGPCRCYRNTSVSSNTFVTCAYIFFLFFYWRFNPLWVLAFSVIFFHSALSSHCFLHRLTPVICKSSSMPAIHLFRGLPLVLVPIGFHCNICAYLRTFKQRAIFLQFPNNDLQYRIACTRD
jgi:hypothetical protein